MKQRNRETMYAALMLVLTLLLSVGLIYAADIITRTEDGVILELHEMEGEPGMYSLINSYRPVNINAFRQNVVAEQVDTILGVSYNRTDIATTMASQTPSGT